MAGALIPNELLAHIASFGDYADAVTWANTSREMKHEIDQTYRTEKRHRPLSVFSLTENRRRFCIVGKITWFWIFARDIETLRSPEFCATIWQGVEKLGIGKDFTPFLNELVLPPGLQDLTIYCQAPVHTLELPSTLKRLYLGYHVSGALEHLKLPAGLEYINLGYSYNQPVVDRVALPAGLKILIMSSCFNQSVAGWKLPAGLRELCFGYDFNQPVDELVLPAGLERLEFGRTFDQPFHNVVLPKGLTYIEFGAEFDQPLYRVKFPPTLKVISISKFYPDWLCCEIRLPPGAVIIFGGLK